MTNNYIKTLYPTGTYLASAKYKHKQCGEYLNDNFLASRQISSSYASKQKLVDKFGFRADMEDPQVGDIVVMDYGTPWGHIAIVNTTDLEKRKICLTDCNLKKIGVVNNDFWIEEGDKNWKRIYGFARLQLNAKTKAAQPQPEFIPPWAKKSVEKAKNKLIVTDWAKPYEEIGNARLEWILEKLGWLDKGKNEGKVTLLRLIVALDKKGFLD